MSSTSASEQAEQLKRFIRSVPGFPRPGINFYDITTLFKDPEGFKLALDELEAVIRQLTPEVVVGVEARGFVLAGALADRLGVGFVPARKPGKLPAETIKEEYSLEYGTDSLEMHVDGVSPGQRVVIVDDLIATGGTLLATARLVERLGGEVAGIAAIIGLVFLPFAEKLAGYPVHYLISYDSE